MKSALSYRSSQLLKTITVQPGKEAQAWAEVCEACPTPLGKWAIEQVLRKGLDGYARTIVIEPLYICKDYRNLYSHFYSKKFVDRPSSCSRLHFFTEPGLSFSDIVLRSDQHQDHYIGYSVVQPVKEKPLGRTVIDPFKVGHDAKSFYCLRTRFNVHLGGAEYAVWGYPYRCQSGEATRCAHSTLWGVCRYLSERYTMYGELYPYDLIQMTGDTRGRRVPYRGMTYTDYSTILSTFGCHPVVRRPKKFPLPNWQDDADTFHDIYAYVESGFPVLMSFRKHVVAVVGHTSRGTVDGHEPDKYGFHNSFSLLRQYVVVDDNFFPYQLLGDRDDAEEDHYGKMFEGQLDPLPSKQDIVSAVVPLPEKAFMESATARQIGTGYFGLDPIRSVLDDTIKAIGIDADESLIARTFMTSSIPFKNRKKTFRQSGVGGVKDRLCGYPMELQLPHFVWVVEISPLSLYNEGICVGEIVIDAAASLKERGVIYARIGNRLQIEDKLTKKLAAPLTFWQYTHNLGEQDND